MPHSTDQWALKLIRTMQEVPPTHGGAILLTGNGQSRTTGRGRILVFVDGSSSSQSSQEAAVPEHCTGVPKLEGQLTGLAAAGRTRPRAALRGAAPNLYRGASPDDGFQMTYSTLPSAQPGHKRLTAA